MAELQKVLASEANRWISDLNDGIHSGLRRQRARGVFFYFKAPRPGGGSSHFWRYYDFQRREIIDNRYQIMQLIACAPETPRFPPPYDEVDIYDLQERVLQNILGDVEQQQAAIIVSKPVAEEQNIASHILREHLSNPALDRAEIRDLRKFLKQPLVGASVQTLRQALKAYTTTSDVAPLIATIRESVAQYGSAFADTSADRRGPRLVREDLHLICYEYVWA